MSILGMRVLIDPASMVVLPTTLLGANTSTIPVPIPDAPALVDAQILVQTFYDDGVQWTASRGLRMTRDRWTAGSLRCIRSAVSACDPPCGLRNGEGLPTPPFATDAWPVVTPGVLRP